MIRFRLFSNIGFLFPLLFIGCDSPSDIEVYQVPKEVSAVPSPASDPHAGVTMPTPGGKDPHAGMSMPVPGVKNPHGEMSGAARKPGVEGKVPASWKAGRPSSMRLASYLVKAEDGAGVDISLITLGGQAGGVLDNINRWRTQIGLDPMDEQGLAKTSQKVTTPLGEAVFVDLEATGPVADESQDGRIVAAILPLDKEMWFYKMRGNRELVGQEKEGFLDWIASARKVKPEKSESTAKKEIPAIVPQKAPAGQTEITWETPEGWRQEAAKSMRLASFSVGAVGGASGEVTVIKLGGKGGGDLANVNRWRGQIGLDPITDTDLASSVASVRSPGGAITHIDCVGSDKKTVAGWIRRNGNTWFFKLTGPTDVVDSERSRFIGFLSTIDFPTK